ncbi:hypothetical protein [Rhizobium sp. BK176]|uniref:hypothetical protein n=1 Tax=Rhizobium sp. BK176 TaxID=2587071 RepID=UPI002168C57E|nr:hypothetical protein [Rhizobium sp. BK176]MCS4089326.1 hypothetical protein [Rhizobium sp. BK176]
MSKTSFDSDTVLPMLDAFQGHSNPLVSHGLNRLLAWLDGPDGRWSGDDRLRVTWQTDVCTLEHCGHAWRLSLEPLPKGKRTVKLARVGEDGGAISLASGKEHPSKGLTWGLFEIGDDDEADVTFENSIDGEVAVGAFEEFCDFMDVVRPSIPQPILDVTAGTVWVTKADEFADFRELVLHDGGLPGRLCKVVDYTKQVLGARDGLLSVIDRYETLAQGLSERGAIWGDNILQYNDGENRCCTIAMGDGSVALYSEHIGGGFAQRGYIAVFDLDSRGKVASVSGYLLDDQEDDEVIVAAVVDRTAVPAFRFDVASQKVELAEGRKGHYAIRLMFLQFAYDEEYAFEDGELKPSKRPKSTRSPTP